MRIQIQRAAKIAELFDCPARMRIAKGGRGSGKSYGFADMALIRTMQKKTRVLCARELQNSIKDSVHKLLVSRIDAHGLGGHFDYGESFIREKFTGSDFIFKGLRNNVNEIKSTEGIDVAWVTEGQGVSKNSWDVLIPTVRNEGSEIWVDYNPLFDDDPIHKMAMQPNERTKAITMNWRDNPWFPEVLNQERLHMLKTDPDLYAHVWEGECRQITDAQVFKNKFSVEDFTAPDFWDGPYFGADWGFAIDPTTLVRMFIYKNILYIDHEAYRVGCDISDTPALFDTVPESRRYKIRADCARPETISHMRNAGFDIEGASKWQGSVEDGITFMRGFEKIVIHPRCTNTIREFRLYSYKTDKRTDDILPQVLDKENHIIDAIRYGLAPMIQKKGGDFLVL